jgi:hypothetical protein
MALTAEQEKILQQLGEEHGKIGHVEHEGHWLAFRTPNEVQVRDYKRKESSAQELPERVWALMQQTLVCFDGVTDKMQCLQAFAAFRVEFPMFDDNGRAHTVVSVLTGVVQSEAANLLGKGCQIWKRTPKGSRSVSADGSGGTSIQTPGPQAAS